MAAFNYIIFGLLALILLGACGVEFFFWRKRNHIKKVLKMAKGDMEA